MVMMSSLTVQSSSSLTSPWTIPGSSFVKAIPFPSKPSVSCCRAVLKVCCGGGDSRTPFSAAELKLVLHDALDSHGIDTTHARDGRRGFSSQIQNLSAVERETSISINRYVDLGKAALYVAAEDDSLISHSSVALPVDDYIERLDDLSMRYCTNNSSSLHSSPENFLDSLERFLYVKKGFRRSSGRAQLEPRALYLHSVLTHRSGSAAMLSLIYSEILKMLRLWGLLEFDCEIYFPHDLHGVPRGYHKLKSKESDTTHIMTSQSLLEEILRNLKEAFWPFQNDLSKSLFLRAARAANCVDRSDNDEMSGFHLASAKAAHHRLDRGVWTSVRFGDMRRALSACERLILLESEPKELRDYSILLYHCGFYDQSLKYLKSYQETKNSALQTQSPSKSSILEEDAVEQLMIRLKLISMEEGWSKPSKARNFLGSYTEPW
ncbi:hypothetical protein K2173_024577 [Erythroxylum novogranatense]|uniref:Protein SirB1 N-terminal domain-containing protein n=1 Tax=Erythroxylum novogranatense TaxID=1862640 RepID=A0AAV8SVS6_9ROSI|nr:hypothetical protein K2173_024577 [Erythroxylum novogranatense]